MKTSRRRILRSAVAAAGALLLPRSVRAAGADEFAGSADKRQRPMRPHLLITARKVQGLRSVEELRQSTRSGHGRVLWSDLKKRADADLKAKLLWGGNRNFTLVNRTIMRVLRHALAFLITGQKCYRDAALAQIEVTFDPKFWPNWRDENQPKNLPAGLRVGQLCFGFGLAYDWLYTSLTPQERRRVVAGIDRCGIRPYVQTVKNGHWQVCVLDNFLPCIVGGVGVAAMAMGDDHPDSEYLMDLAVERMGAYLGVFGPEGEWNESVYYAGSIVDAVAFFSALRYWSAVRVDTTGEDIIATYPLPQFCRWLMYMTTGGREARFGDCGARPRKIALPYVPAVAAAARDGVLQWYYLNNLFPTEETNNLRNYALELVWYDHMLKPLTPEGRLPHGHAFSANMMCVSSRTDWNPRATPCVVYGKGGAAYEVHGHHDAGQVCIDGYGQPLIIDPGGYGVDNREYYKADGHNVLTFNGQDMVENRPESRALYNRPEQRKSPLLRSKFVSSAFDDGRGGYWVLDTADLYEGVRDVLRTVVHLNPGVVVVLDRATLHKPADVSLRWHTADKCQPDANGRFRVQGGQGVHLASRVLRLDDGELAVERREHEETRNSYIEASLHGVECSFLSLFCVFGPAELPAHWEGSNGSWSIQAPEGLVDVKLSSETLSVGYRDSPRGWRV